MKFTEGFWLRSEQANALYASCAYELERIEGGMRILAPTARIDSRGATLNLPTITLEFRATGRNAVTIRSWHFAGYDTNLPRFETNEDRREVEVCETASEFVMSFDDLTITVVKDPFSYRFEANGKIITECGFRNLGYMRWNRQPSTMLPQANYLDETRCEPYMLTELSVGAEESIYGFGERFTAFAKNGQTVQTWNEDGGTASDIAYKSIPFYMSNRGYGVFVNHTGNVSFEVASEKVGYVGFSVPGESLEYTFFYGPDLHDVLRGYTDMTGKPALPPAWSFGLWLSTSFTTDYDEETTSSFIQGMAERDIPLSVFHFDCFWMREFRWCDFEWDERVFPDTQGMLQRYKDKGLKICVWINPYIAQNTELFREGMREGYLLMRADGRGVWQTDNWQAGMAVVDFTNPAACAWYQRQLKRLLDLGVDCFKTDFGERIPVNVSYYDGSDPVAMHNYYTYLYNKCVFDLLKRERGEGDAVLFARSATAGSQQFPVHWGGDCMATYPSMAETLRGGLSFAMSGFSFWSHDISGFESTATPDLYKRWAAFGLLSTHSRLHGSTSYRVPWLFDEEANEVVRAFTRLKCKLMPYLYSKSVEAHREGIPVMRPMVLEFTEDPAVRYLDLQYMLGDALLVAPVFNDDSRVRFYLPEGRWTDLLSGQVRDGGRWFEAEYDYFSLPLYVRENSLLPVGNVEDRPDYDFANDLELHYYLPSNNGLAVCSIVDKQGLLITEVSAERTGNKIKLSGLLPDADWKIVLHDSVSDTMVINVDKSEVEVEL
ncbi:MAG: alpha-D-xyloside xylohydrolase [Clostridiales bacterium]|nr:alpha-D-xyloside xylohydrolase [Clostridiales bacterium]